MQASDSEDRGRIVWYAGADFSLICSRWMAIINKVWMSDFNKLLNPV